MSDSDVPIKKKRGRPRIYLSEEDKRKRNAMYARKWRERHGKKNIKNVSKEVSEDDSDDSHVVDDSRNDCDIPTVSIDNFDGNINLLISRDTPGKKI